MKAVKKRKIILRESGGHLTKVLFLFMTKMVVYG